VEEEINYNVNFRAILNFINTDHVSENFYSAGCFVFFGDETLSRDDRASRGDCRLLVGDKIQHPQTRHIVRRA